MLILPQSSPLVTISSFFSHHTATLPPPVLLPSSISLPLPVPVAFRGRQQLHKSNHLKNLSAAQISCRSWTTLAAAMMPSAVPFDTGYLDPVCD
jgi:hypothetical protein